MLGTNQVIDVWLQHPTLPFINHPMFESLRRWMGTGLIEQEIPLSSTIEAMDQGGVDVALACAWWGPSGALISNQDVVKAVTAYPRRLKGIASLNLYNPMDAVRTLRRMVGEYGFVGARQVQWLWNLPPTDRRYYPLYSQCVELDIPICLQVGHTGPLCPSEPGRPIPYIDEVALDFPELKIICGHVGYPWTQEMIAVATKHRNVFIDTSAYSAKRFPPELVKYMQTNGRKKVMFGTNYPMISPKQCLEDLDSLNLDEDTRALFLAGNAKRIFKL